MSANQADGHRLHEVSSDGKNLSELFFLESLLIKSQEEIEENIGTDFGYHK